MIKVYQYSKCDTCRKALKFLNAKGVEYQCLPIVEQPPSKAELRQMLAFLKAGGGGIKNLFNTSGVQYRELNISDKFKAGMSESEAIDLLSGNGKLIKRPFLLTGSDGRVGFKPEEWRKLI